MIIFNLHNVKELKLDGPTLAWISTDKHSANAALAQEGYGTAESGSERYLKGCTDKSIARSLFADGDRPWLCSTRMAGYATPRFMRVFWRSPYL